MPKIFKKAIIFHLPISLLIGIGRGTEVIPTTKEHANRILNMLPDILISEDDNITQDILDRDDVDLSFHNAVGIEKLTFASELKEDEEYSEMLYISPNFSAFFLVRAL